MMNVRLYNISIKCMLAILLSALFASCKDEMDELGERPSRGDALAIRFSTIDEGFEKPTTRSGALEEFKTGDQVSVLAMKKQNGNKWNKVFGDNESIVITNVGTSIWSYDNKQKWENCTYRFRAFYPCSPDAFNTEAGESCEKGFEWSTSKNEKKDFQKGYTDLMLTNYKSADDPRKNSDLMVSDLVERSPGNTDVVLLNMKHLLANVSFNFVSKEGKTFKITNFSVNGYSSIGNYEKNKKGDFEWNTEIQKVDGKIREVEFSATLDKNDYFVTYDNEKYLVKSLENNKVVPFEGTYEEWGTLKTNFKEKAIQAINIWNFEELYYLELASNNTKNIYVNEGKEKYQNYLFIPQDLTKQKSEEVNVKFILKEKQNDAPYVIANPVHNKVIIKSNGVNAEVEFYFYDEDGNPKDTQHATIDLTAGKKITSWDAGKKYTYTVGMYEHQVNVNIDVAPWETHTLDGGDLR